MRLNSNTRLSLNPPTADISRSKFDRSFNYKTTFAAGKLIPFFCDEVLPGDTFSIDTSFVCRGATPVFPVMDNSFLDMWYFYVPQRLVWEHTREFYGENNTSAWIPEIEYTVPQIYPPDDGFAPGSVADYFGLPTNVATYTDGVNALPFRAYALIWNEWFRAEALQDPVLVNTSDTEPNTDGYLFNLLRVNKKPDYFTTALPSPQRGPSVLLPLGDYAEVITSSSTNSRLSTGPMIMRGAVTYPGATPPFYEQYPTNLYQVSEGGSRNLRFGANVEGSQTVEQEAVDLLYPINLRADLSSATSATINQLRQAFAVQRLYERSARAGGRYREFIKAFFGVSVPDSTVQIPEYLGGKSYRVNVTQVIQQSSTDEVSPQGNAAAFSKTVGSDHNVSKSFTEPGYIIGVLAVRTDHTYQQGIERMWSRKSRFDFYNPVFANLGEQAILNKEIYAAAADPDGVFGYNEAWADYRYKPNRVTGAFRSNYPGGSLDAWHYADDYAIQPFLSAEWMEEPSENVARTLALVDPAYEDQQYLIDMYISMDTVRPMPLYSIPGLIDHH